MFPYEGGGAAGPNGNRNWLRVSAKLSEILCSRDGALVLMCSSKRSPPLVPIGVNLGSRSSTMPAPQSGLRY